MKLSNSKGSIFYDMHFYPGVAEYREADGSSFRVFLNESTIRNMGPTFAGRPVFVHHVDGVDPDINRLREGADGWVIESFFNEADGKHWAKFIVCSDKGLKAIKAGYRLSNCYVPKAYNRGGTWNGVEYQKEITSGEFEHLAIVQNPRYEESVILSPEEFKAYNDRKRTELTKLSNEEQEGAGMKLKFFKREKVENSVDLEQTLVALPKSGREVSISTLVNEADEIALAKDKPRFVNVTDLVKIGEEEVSIGDLIADREALANARKKANEEDEEDGKKENEEDEEDGKKENEEDEEDEEEKKEEKKENKKKNEADEIGDESPKAKANKLKNANRVALENEAEEFDVYAGVNLGKSRYGS